MSRLFFEDLEVGRPIELGSYTITEEEIVAFGERYDPLPIHVDEDAAKESMYGERIASGLHTLCRTNRVVTEEFRLDAAVVTGIGIDELRFRQPVRPGTALTVHLEIEEKRVSESRPDAGVVSERITTKADGEPVLSYVDVGLYERRDA